MEMPFEALLLDYDCSAPLGGERASERAWLRERHRFDRGGKKGRQSEAGPVFHECKS